MTRHVEPLNGGLWTAEDAGLLEPGQLTKTQNAIYLPGSQLLTRARGRTEAGSATGAANVDGLRDIEFDNGDHLLVAMVSGLYRYSAVGDTLSFVTLTAAATGASQLEVVHYRNRFFLLNGATADASSTGTNFVAYLTATAASGTPTARQHGMLPVIAAPSVSGSATAFSQTVTGYYEYWTTEVAKFTQDGALQTLESAFSSDTNPTTIYVSSTGMAPVIQMPSVRNTEIMTHWRVYRSPKKDKESDRKFPSGFMIAEVATATGAATGWTQVVDSSTVSSASGLPTSFNTTGFFFDWANASAGLTASAGGAGGFASATAVLLGTPRKQGAYGYNFGGFSGSVKGIQVQLAAYIASGSGSTAYPLTVTIGKRRAADGGFVSSLAELAQGTQKIASKSAVITASAIGSPQTVTLGASADRWFASDKPGLVDSDFDANFMTVVEFSKPGVLAVDYLKTFVYYASTVDGTVQYPSVVYTFGDIVAQVSKNHPPSNASTGDLFEDSLVINDTSNPALIRWSAPGEPEYFPPTYFLDFETRENDQVRLIKVVNSVLMVGLDASLWAVNYLPSERDSSFDRGKALRAISKNYGVVNPMCACTFSTDDAPEILAFVSNHGIHTTDGYNFSTQTNGLNWDGVISRTGNGTPICLINDREREEILFYYRNDDLTPETYMCLHLSYAADHMSGRQMKISGPVHMRNLDVVGGGTASLESAWAVQRSTGATDIFLGYGGASAAAGAGRVYRETGTTIPAADSTVKWSSRVMYLAGMGNEFVAGDVYGYCGTYAGSPVITYTAQNRKTNDAGPSTIWSKDITLGGQRLHKISPRATFEGMQVTAQVTATTFGQASLIIDGEGWGEEDSGR